MTPAETASREPGRERPELTWPICLYDTANLPVWINRGLLCPSFASVKLANNTRPSLLVHNVEVFFTRRVVQ
jgi:hypothetical protein